MEGILGKLDGEEIVIVDPAVTEPREISKLLVGAIVPRPIAFVSTVSAAGVLNVAPFSYFTVISANPPVICFSPSVRRDGTTKDTLHNIQATGEFVVNIVSESIAERMNLCSGEYTPDVDEFALSGLTPVPSDLVCAPRVQESPVNMECKLLQVVEISVKPSGGSLVIGEIVRFHVDDAIMRDGSIDPDLLLAVGRMGGTAYSRTRERFHLERPK